MKRPKSAELLSLGMERFSPDEFRYHRQLMHNRPTSVRDEDDRSENSFLTDIINRGPSHLKGTSLFQVGLSRSTYRSEKRLKACKQLDIVHFLKVTRKIRRIKQESHLIESELQNSPHIKVPNAKIIIAQINSSFNHLLRHSTLRKLNSSMLKNRFGMLTK